MTDILLLAHKLFKRIEWQTVPDVVTLEDLTVMIADAIRYLYIITDRALAFDEEMFTIEEGVYISFKEDLKLDEREYVLITAEIDLYRKAQTSVNELTSYSTDAMTVSHGDKPFANLQQTIDDAERRRDRIWYKMGRFHLL